METDQTITAITCVRRRNQNKEIERLVELSEIKIQENKKLKDDLSELQGVFGEQTRELERSTARLNEEKLRAQTVEAQAELLQKKLTVVRLVHMFCRCLCLCVVRLCVVCLHVFVSVS